MKRTLKRGLKDLKSLKRKQLKKLSGCDNASLTGIKPNVILHRSLRVRSLLWFIAIRRQNEVLHIINALENAPFFLIGVSCEYCIMMPEGFLYGDFVEMASTDPS